LDKAKHITLGNSLSKRVNRNMSKTTKRKHVTKEALDEYYVPEGDEEVVKILGGRGNNLHEVECADGKTFLASMPTKFRKNLWIKRGDFVVISPIKEGNKVQAEIVYVLYQKQIKYLQEQNLWPAQFLEKEEISDGKENGEDLCNDSDEDEEDDLLFKNPNRREFVHVEESDSSSEEEEDSEEEYDEEDPDGDSSKQQRSSSTAAEDQVMNIKELKVT